MAVREKEMDFVGMDRTYSVGGVRSFGSFALVKLSSNVAVRQVPPLSQSPPGATEPVLEYL